MNFEELVLKYATLMPVRFNYKQKLMFINEIGKEYERLGYNVRAVVNKKRRSRGLNLLVGDLKDAKTLIIAGYDTPQRNYGNPLNYFPLNGSASFVSSFFAYHTPLILGGAVALFVLIVGMPKVDFTDNFWQSLLIILVFALSLVASTVLTKGVANKFNYNRNTSGVIGSLLLAEKMAKRKGIAFVLTDMSCMNHMGDRMMNDALPNTLKDKTVILLDCIGHGARVGVGYREKAERKAEELIKCFNDDKLFRTVIEGDGLKYSSANYYEKGIVVSYGKKQNDVFIVQNTACSKDKSIDGEAVEMIVESLYKFLTK